MVIRISLGAVGSGKTLMEVRNMFLNDRQTYFSNIDTNIKNQINIDPSMIIKKEVSDYKKNRKTGEETPVYSYKLNTDYWKKATKKYGSISVIIDEAHSILNARRSMSKTNVIISDWLALVRRVVGQDSQSEGELVLISQLWNRLDSIARDMASQVTFSKAYYTRACLDCGTIWGENSEQPEKPRYCISCDSAKLHKYNYYIELWKFNSMNNFLIWNSGFNGSKGSRPYYQHYFVSEVETYFPMYDTLSWSNMFSEYYS